MSITRIERLKKELDGAIQEPNFELALEVIDDLIGLDGESAMFWNSKGVILSKLNRTKEAIDAFDQALEMDPDESKVWYSKGSVLLNLNRLRHALACFYKALDIEPGYAKAKEKFMFCLDEMVKIDKIKLMEALKEEPPILDEEVVSEDVDQGEEDEEMPVDPWAEGKGSRLVDDLFDGDDKEEEAEGWGTEDGDSSVDDLFDDDDGSGDPSDLQDTDETDVSSNLQDGDPEDGYLEDDDEEVLEFTDEDDDEEDEGWGDDDDEEDAPELDENDDEDDGSFMVPRKQFDCKCGSLITIDSDRRPYKFECGNCGRTGTIVK
ncbi:MAG: tetratricopeptide repeat protein [Thermoplasmata archaeon]|nr:tetratricopeptide repeat protein [Thermoplasmata archaeon]